VAIPVGSVGVHEIDYQRASPKEEDEGEGESVLLHYISGA
jgi:hypothetical protein